MSADPSRKIILGSGGNELARAQTAMVAKALQRAWPALEVAIEIIKTQGDERSAEPIDPRSGRKGLFTGEIERALVAGRIDVAVHSAKDLPSNLVPGTQIAAVLPRGSVDDALVAFAPYDLQSLPLDGIVATGSVRRKHQLR